MKTFKIPSFFKFNKPKKFSFYPRYYNEIKERRAKLQKGEKANIKFRRQQTKQTQKARAIRILFLIIILSLLAYKIIIN
tara:strand:+ start:579 stop:815 length:237 start_codon:yes stop_codon:yes gene_type:complete